MSDNQKDRFKCHICNESGHGFRSCKKSYCLKCNKTGHLTAFCQKELVEPELFAMEFMQGDIRARVTRVYPREECAHEMETYPLAQMPEFAHGGVRICSNGQKLFIAGYDKTVTILLNQTGREDETCITVNRTFLTVGQRYTVAGALTYNAANWTASGRRTQEFRLTPIYVVISGKDVFANFVRLTYYGFRHVLSWVVEPGMGDRLEALLLSASQYNGCCQLNGRFNATMAVRGNVEEMLPAPRRQASTEESANDESARSMQSPTSPEKNVHAELITSPEKLTSDSSTPPSAQKASESADVTPAKHTTDNVKVPQNKTEPIPSTSTGHTAGARTAKVVEDREQALEKPVTQRQVIGIVQYAIAEALKAKKSSRRKHKSKSRERNRKGKKQCESEEEYQEDALEKYRYQSSSD